MLTAKAFAAEVAELAGTIIGYEEGKSGQNGRCDCIGLIMGAMRSLARKSYPLHSTNYFARFEMTALNALDNENQLSPGMLVYKAREDSGQLNDRYKQGGRYYVPGDLKDYYHVGVVTSVSPLEITHCTQTEAVDGIAYDQSARGWTLYGWLEGVAANGREETMTMAKNATVTAANGKPVNLRKGPGTNYTYIAKVPVGTVVTVNEQAQGWAQVTTGGKTGYMMTDFLAFDEPEPADSAEETETGAVYNPDFEERVISMLEAIIDNLNAMGGVG